MKVRELIQAGFVTASSKYPDIQEAWVETSYRIGARLPNSMLVHSIQKAGHLDIVIRCMEDEFSATNPDMAFNYQMLFSELWIGQVYEFVRLVKQRKLVPENDEFVQLARDLTLVRIPLEKHEIPSDWKIKEPLKMQRQPPKNDPTDIYEYSFADSTRAHIMQVAVSHRGSAMWEALDITSTPPQSHWVERRGLSERVLALSRKSD